MIRVWTKEIAKYKIQTPLQNQKNSHGTSSQYNILVFLLLCLPFLFRESVFCTFNQGFSKCKICQTYQKAIVLSA